MAVYDIVHEVPPDAELRFQTYPLLAELGFEGAGGPVQGNHVFGAKGLSREVHPQVSRRGTDAYRHPKEFSVRDPPPLQGYREEAVWQACVAVAALATGLFNPGTPRGA